ncbi:MAG TPA: HAD-IIB family hydrolase [Candidatus Paceibacterota bacterium]|nr:HAD-IIB family hydrolase [Candidatus Paceibacterota bacterium]
MSNPKGKKVLVFDLDGTLTESKLPVDAEMAALLTNTLTHTTVAVISGGGLPQFEKQVLPFLALTNEQQKNLFLLPTSGAALFAYEDGALKKIYEEKLTSEEIAHIENTLEKTIDDLKLRPEQTYGALIENRGSQVTYSALGQEARLEKKAVWDPDQEKRKQIVAALAPSLPNFHIGIGGTTSIDITKKGIDKAYGIKKLSEYLHIPITEMAFIGDALFPGGNDEAARASGIKCISVKDVSETKELLKNLSE